MVFTLQKFYSILSTMGKSKKRLLHKTNSSLYMTRESAVNEVFGILQKPTFSKVQAKDLITLFGLSAEELSEAGVAYENIKALEPFIG